MKKVNISVNFTNATGGQVQIIIQGPGTKYDYSLINDEVRSLDLLPAIYTIQVNGTSGGTLDLSVTENGNSILVRNCPPPHLFILDSFTV